MLFCWGVSRGRSEDWEPGWVQVGERASGRVPAGRRLWLSVCPGASLRSLLEPSGVPAAGLAARREEGPEIGADFCSLGSTDWGPCPSAGETEQDGCFVSSHEV